MCKHEVNFCANIFKEKETLLLFRICYQRKYRIKAIFTVFALPVIVTHVTRFDLCANMIKSK